MQSSQHATRRPAQPLSSRPLEPVQVLSRVLAVLLAIVPLALVLTAAAWRPLDETAEAVRSNPGAHAQTGAGSTRSSLAPTEGPFAED